MIKFNEINTISGTGLIALDYLIQESNLTTPQLYLGGSCGNVLAGLSYLNWNSYPIARLDNSPATDVIFEEFEKWNLRTNFVTRTSDGSTPVIVQKLYEDIGGNIKHKFEFKCPTCGTWLPSYKAVLAKKTKELIQGDLNPQVFYFDRVSRGALILAEHYKSKGALIYFEPPSLKDSNQFKEAIEIADIIKFSAERIDKYESTYTTSRGLLEVITYGEKGIKYRFQNDEWKLVSPININNMKDTAGAGDWCSIGIIWMLNHYNIDKLNQISIENAINLGQALGALNCQFPGARGIMYNLSIEELAIKLDKILQQYKIMDDLDHVTSFSSDLYENKFCDNCIS